MTCALAITAAYLAGLASARLWRRVAAWWQARHFDHTEWD